MLSWMLEKDVWDAFHTCTGGVEGGHEHVLEWALENNYPLQLWSPKSPRLGVQNGKRNSNQLSQSPSPTRDS